jgi:LCP family protein required for cell wall assembly
MLMVEPKPDPRKGALNLRKLNAKVAAGQPFTASMSQPGLGSNTPRIRPTGPEAIARPLRRPLALRRHLLVSAATLLVVAGGAFGFNIYNQLHSKLSAASIVVSAAKAAAYQPVKLQGQAEGRTNFLVFGMTKDGLRTDSIMLASYYYKQKKLVTLNIPRDLYVNDGYETAKMGEVYAYAKMRQPKNSQYPDQFVTQLISKEYGISIPYWVELNMQGEVSLINDIGGVDINVPDSFTDYEYPTWNYSGYVRPAPSFVAGEQHMDGNTALIFSRSRHSLDNNEGTDFARSKRQGLVLSAIMTKVKSQGILGNLGQLSKYLGLVNQNVTTNMSTDEMVASGLLAKSLNPATDHLIGNWSTTNGFLCDTVTPGGADIVLYGVTGSCTTEAGGQEDSTYREQAINYVQNLLTSVSPPATGTTTGTATGASSQTVPTTAPGLPTTSKTAN